MESLVHDYVIYTWHYRLHLYIVCVHLCHLTLVVSKSKGGEAEREGGRESEIERTERQSGRDRERQSKECERENERE